ncbi:MAG TPA: NAD(P)H-binding protein [Kiritimatiellia bacterium]|nr:NAD(P)H-binding protein [Kiritimatiellia bacterium]HPA79064.1 NAD(P)H-binding protein [Kiritimatiellia bacterium]
MRILIAGAGGVLGRHLVTAFLARDHEVLAIAYAEREFEGMAHERLTTRACDVTKPEQITGICNGMDMVISCVGITRVHKRLSHMHVDYEGNVNLLREAEKGGVKKFGFISPAGVDEGRHKAPLLKAKYLFEQELKKSKIPWAIFRSGGFYSDLAEMGKMAGKGVMYLVGPGTAVSTPLGARELAEIMADDLLAGRAGMISVGGPEDLSWNDICERCFAHHGRSPSVMHVPVWICRLFLALMKPFSVKYYGMGRLILFMSVTDLPTEKRSKLSFAEYLAAAPPPVPE